MPDSETMLSPRSIIRLLPLNATSFLAVTADSANAIMTA